MNMTDDLIVFLLSLGCVAVAAWIVILDARGDKDD
jgi:hypothetical protein